MTRERKYSSGVSFGDVGVYCENLLTWHDLQVEIVLRRVGVNDRLVQGVVRLHEGKRYMLGEKALVENTFALSLSGEGQWSQAMIALQAAVNDYEANPWQWTERTRRREVATQAESTPL